MESLLNIIMIMFILAFIIEQSGITIQISKTIFNLINKYKKWNGEIIKSPFTCLSCSVFWTILLYCLLNNNIIFSLFIASVCSTLSKIPSIIIEKIKKIILKYEKR